MGTYCPNIYCALRAGWHWQEIGKIGGRIVTYGSYMLGISHQAQCYMIYYVDIFWGFFKVWVVHAIFDLKSLIASCCAAS